LLKSFKDNIDNSTNNLISSPKHIPFHNFNKLV